MLDTLLPLQRLTSQGMSVLVLHHPRKGDVIAAQAARGMGQALERDQVLRAGAGWKGDPYRYWLPGQEEKWRQSPFHVSELPEEVRRVQQMAAELRRRLLEE